MRTESVKRIFDPRALYVPVQDGLEAYVSGNAVSNLDINIIQSLNAWGFSEPGIAQVKMSESEPTADRASSPQSLVLYSYLPTSPARYSPYWFVFESAANRFLTTGLDFNVQLLGSGEQLSSEVLQVNEQVSAAYATHKSLMTMLCEIATQAAITAGAALIRIRVLPDFSHEYDANNLIVFEAVLRANGRRSVYWTAIEAKLWASLSQLPSEEQAFFEQSVSFEVSEE